MIPHKTCTTIGFVSSFLLALLSTTASAEDPVTNLGKEQAHGPLWQEPIYLQAADIAWQHEIRVSLPPTYYLDPDATFPVLWVTDGSLYFGAASEMAALYAVLGHMPPVIVVGVGHPATDTRSNFQQKRARDFIFEDYIPFDPGRPEDPALARLLEQNPGLDLEQQRQGAVLHGAKFLRFLVDEVRPHLAETYRMADDHGIFGHSGGGMFVGRAMFERPGAFKRFILSSGLSYDAFAAEQRYATEHDDMNARVFIAAGDQEAEVASRASQRLVSNMMRFGEDLVLREHPSLDVEIRVYREKNHAAVPALSLSEGMLWVYRDLLAEHSD